VRCSTSSSAARTNSFGMDIKALQPARAKTSITLATLAGVSNSSLIKRSLATVVWE
jgi:hypothetical protein